MREVNFSIPNVNKASVGITTALYDRRALDCTSTLPLINSLNHLAYLTTSSARIRDILTVDGGVERLVCILKAGRSKDLMDMWKWNLAFQCVVNIGVRGSENVRTRVVEADMVPVIATILDNYIQVVDRCREKAEEATAKRDRKFGHSSSREHRGALKSSSFTNRSSRVDAEHRTFRRQPPPQPIDVSASFGNAPPPPTGDSSAMDITPTAPQFALTSPPERTTFSINRHSHHHHHNHHHHHHRGQDANARLSVQPLATAVPSMDTADGFGLRPLRDGDRLPSMVSGFHAGLTSQPESPTTPLPPPQVRSPTVRPAHMSAPSGRSRRRPSIRHQLSSTAESDDGNADMVSDEPGEPEVSGPSVAPVPTVGIQDITMDDEGDSMLTAVETPLGLTTPGVSEAQDAGTFNITHRSAIDGSIIANDATPTGPTIGLSPAQANTNNSPPTMPHSTIPRYLLDNRHTATANPSMLAAMPRDEDVLMSLQLLAYVSKYCNLRSYFQRSHLVPKLRIGGELQLLDLEDPSTGGHVVAPTPGGSGSSGHEEMLVEDVGGDEAEEEEEYLLPDDFNIFPLVEKFTIRHHSQDMQYWAGVVMRNLCRKDESRQNIRQCAYYKCGKWEEWTRQFAKCRRCRRTKYCSKECQKSAWVFHRHWCVAASGSS